MQKKEIFPIKTATSCPLKWNFSSLYLNTGSTSSCHRASFSKLTSENFFDFHNTEVKLLAREKMLKGEWPNFEENDSYSCNYCKKIEDNYGFSDRQYQLTIPHFNAPELQFDKQAIKVSPTLLEIFFNNTCNLSCNYCKSSLSSRIAAEDKKFGYFKKNDVEINLPLENNYKVLTPIFWKWFDENYQSLRWLNIMGGEPFLQQEFQELINFFETKSNANCELQIITNLALSFDIIETNIKKIKKLCKNKKIKKFTLICSIDCWGAEQEYVRHGLNLDIWERNFTYLLNEKWIYLCTNSLVTPLTIKTMPKLFQKINEWKKIHKIHQQVGYIQGPIYWKPEIFGGDFFLKDLKNILDTMSENTEEEKNVKKYMEGIVKVIKNGQKNDQHIKNFITFLKEKDRRRNTNYKKIFSWLEEFDT